MTAKAPANDTVKARFPVDVLGSVPEGAVGWRVQKAVGKSWKLLHEDGSGGLVVSEWPLAEFSLKLIRDRWGSGSYRVIWVGLQENGKHGQVGQSRQFAMKGKEGEAPALPALPAGELGLTALTGGGADLHTMLALLRAEDDRREAKRRAEMEEQEAKHRRELERERLAFEHQIKSQQFFFKSMFDMRAASAPAAAVDLSPLLHELEDLRERLDDRDDEDDEQEDKEPKWLGTVVGLIKTLQDRAGSKPETSRDHASTPPARKPPPRRKPPTGRKPPAPEKEEAKPPRKPRKRKAAAE